MKWYFSGRTRNIDKFKLVTNFLKDQGHNVVSDWIYEDNLKPFSDNIDKVRDLADRCLLNILDSNIFVVFNNIYGTDLYTETGIALAARAIGRDIRIYVIGEYEDSSLMQRHDTVIHLNSLEEVFTREGVNYNNFNIPIFD